MRRLALRLRPPRSNAYLNRPAPQLWRMDSHGLQHPPSASKRSPPACHNAMMAMSMTPSAADIPPAMSVATTTSDVSESFPSCVQRARSASHSVSNRSYRVGSGDMASGLTRSSRLSCEQVYPHAENKSASCSRKARTPSATSLLSRRLAHYLNDAQGLVGALQKSAPPSRRQAIRAVCLFE